MITLREYQSSAPIQLSIEERDGLASAIRELRIEPVPGRNDWYVLTPGSWIGTATLGRLSITIEPKLPIDRVLFLLSYCIGPADWKQNSFKYDYAESLVEAMVTVFHHHLERAFARGILQGYQSEDASLNSVRGRIRFGDQIRRHYTLPLPVEVQFDDFTEDITENRLIRAALEQLGRIRIRSEQSRSTLRRFKHLLDPVVSLTSFLPNNVPAVTYTRLNERYRPAVEWARLILRFSSIETKFGTMTGSTVLFDMNSIFEEFVRIALRESLHLGPQKFPSGPECPHLHLDSAELVSLEPDLSWWSESHCRFVGDVKYKKVTAPGIKHPDLYQLLAYLTATDLENGILIYAAGEASEACHEIKFANKLIYIRTLQLSGSPAEILEQIDEIGSLIMRLSDANTLIATRAAS